MSRLRNGAAHASRWRRQRWCSRPADRGSGIANVPLPGGPGAGPGAHDDLRPDAGYVGAQRQQPGPGRRRLRRPGASHRVEELGRDADDRSRTEDVELPVNTLAKIGQTSLLGSPARAAGRRRRTRRRRSWRRATRSRCRTLRRSRPPSGCWPVSPSILTGGGVSNLEMIGTKIDNDAQWPRPTRSGEFLGRLDTFTDEAEPAARRHHARDRFHEPVADVVVAERNDTLDAVLTEFPPLIQHFADTRDLFADAVQALGEIGGARRGCAGSRRATTSNKNLVRSCSARSRTGQVRDRIWPARSIDLLRCRSASTNVPKVIRGDYINISASWT